MRVARRERETFSKNCGPKGHGNVRVTDRQATRKDVHCIHLFLGNVVGQAKIKE